MNRTSSKSEIQIVHPVLTPCFGSGPETETDPSLRGMPSGIAERDDNSVTGATERPTTNHIQ